MYKTTMQHKLRIETRALNKILHGHNIAGAAK